MQIPSIARGKRFQLPRPVGSADALLLARHAQARKAAGQLLCVVAAEAADAQRLVDELPFFAPELRVALFPDWETLPYDSFSPHQDLISERLATLWRVRGHDLDVVLLPASTALARLAPPSFVAGYTFHFKQKMRLDEAALKSQLTLAGYQHVSQVVSPGEYAVRGGLIDLFPMGSLVPYRVDLFGDEVDSIRAFDPDSQRSLYPVPEVRLLPGREFPMDEAARNAFRARWREKIEGDPSRHRIYKDIASGIATCRCSSSRRRRSSTTSAKMPRWCCTARWTTHCSTSGPTPANAIASCSMTRSGRYCRRRNCSCASRTFSPAPANRPRWCCAATAKSTGRGRCPTSAWTGAPPSR